MASAATTAQNPGGSLMPPLSGSHAGAAAWIRPAMTTAATTAAADPMKARLNPFISVDSNPGRMQAAPIPDDAAAVPRDAATIPRHAAPVAGATVLAAARTPAIPPHPATAA